MGRMFEILKHADPAPAPPTLPFSEPAAVPRVLRDPAPEPEPDEDADDQDIPYIEVGPHKSMEASPSVLAAAPPKVNLPKVELDEPLLVPADPPSTTPAIFFRPAPPEALRPPSPLAPDLIAFHDPDHPVSGQYHDLLTSLTASLPAGRPLALLFTSPLPDAPTTTVLLNLALTAARLGRRVVLLDADPCRANVAPRLGLLDNEGLRQVLAGATPLDDALQKTVQPNLFALTAGAASSAAALRFVAETVRSVLRRLRQRFDLVFIAGPTWDTDPDALPAALACDAALIVLPSEHAESPRVDELFQTLPAKGVRLAGCIFVGGITTA